MSDYQNRSSVAKPGRVNGERDLVVSPSMLRWAAEGKIHEAGFGVEDSGENSQGSVADITGTFALQAPTGGNTIMIPLVVRAFMLTEGGAAPDVLCAITKPASLCATSLTLSGTALTSKHCCYRSNPAQTGQTATALYGDSITVSALVAADYVVINEYHLPDNLISAGTAPVLPLEVYSYAVDGPHLLADAAAILIYTSTGTSDSTWGVYFKWAEVSIDDCY